MFRELYLSNYYGSLADRAAFGCLALRTHNIFQQEANKKWERDFYNARDDVQIEGTM